MHGTFTRMLREQIPRKHNHQTTMPSRKKRRRDTTQCPKLLRKIGGDAWQVVLALLTIRDLCNFVGASKTSRRWAQIAISRLRAVYLEHAEEAEIAAKNCKHIIHLIIDECFFQPLNQESIIKIFENNPDLIVSARHLTKSTFLVLFSTQMPIQRLSQETVFNVPKSFINRLIKRNKTNLLHLRCDDYLNAIPCKRLQTLSTRQGITGAEMRELCQTFPKLRSLSFQMFPADTGFDVRSLKELEEITYIYHDADDYELFGIPLQIKAIRVVNPIRFRTLPSVISKFKDLIYLDIRIGNYYNAICILKGCVSLKEFHVGQMNSRMCDLVGRVVTKSLVVWKIEDDWILEASKNVDFVFQIAPNLKCLRVKGKYLLGDVLSVWTQISPWFKIC